MEGSTGLDRFTFTALTDSTTVNADVITDFLANAEADKIVLTGLGFTGIGAGATELAVSYVNEFTVLTNAATNFQIKLLGYYELGVEMNATDFTF